jgi:hypothetical protein
MVECPFLLNPSPQGHNGRCLKCLTARAAARTGDFRVRATGPSCGGNRGEINGKYPKYIEISQKMDGLSWFIIENHYPKMDGLSWFIIENH